MAKTEPEYAVIEVRLPAKLGEIRDLPIEVTTHVGGEVRKHTDELTLCDGLDTDMFSLSPLKPFAKKVPGMKWRDEENFSHFAPSRRAAQYRAALLTRLFYNGGNVWFEDDYDRALIRSLPGYQETGSDPWGTAPWEYLSSVYGEDGVLIYTYRRDDP